MLWFQANRRSFLKHLFNPRHGRIAQSETFGDLRLRLQSPQAFSDLSFYLGRHFHNVYRRQSNDAKRLVTAEYLRIKTLYHFPQ